MKNISEDYQTMSKSAARMLAAEIRAFKPSAEKLYLNIGLSTGSAPLGMYKELIRMGKEDIPPLDFSHVNFFNLDEYVGLLPDHPQSYHAEMQENFFRHIPAGKKPHSTNIPDGTLAMRESEKACDDYEKKIREARGIDIQVLGIGENGHLGFVEPGSDPTMKARTGIIKLHKGTRQANARFFGDDISKVPTHAISMGLGTIMEAKKVLLLANGPKEGQGKKKVRALKKTWYGPVTADVPASILQTHPDAHYFLTKESTKAIDFVKEGERAMWKAAEAAKRSGKPFGSYL